MVGVHYLVHWEIVKEGAGRPALPWDMVEFEYRFFVFAKGFICDLIPTLEMAGFKCDYFCDARAQDPRFRGVVCGFDCQYLGTGFWFQLLISKVD